MLIRGTSAESSGWRDVAGGLRQSGYSRDALANPLRGPNRDANCMRAFATTIEGPVVVGQSYGGSVMTNADARLLDVQALVYTAADGPDESDTFADAGTPGDGTNHLIEHLVTRPYPGAPLVDGYINPAYSHGLFCADGQPELATRPLWVSHTTVAPSTAVDDVSFLVFAKGS